MEGILAVKKNNYEEICIIRLVMALPAHGVYDVLSIPVVIKWQTELILLQSLYEDLYCDPLFEVVGAVQRPIPFGEWFIGRFSVSIGFGDKVIVSYQKMQVIKVTILSKNEVKI